MTESLIKIDYVDNVASLVLNRPEKRNALTRNLLRELSQALSDLGGEKRVRAIILSGDGPSFCAGMDLKEMAETAKLPDSQAMWDSDARIYLEVIEKILRLPKPVIAAVDGAAVAGGGGIVLACDLVVASTGAKFGFPEPRRGIVAGIVAPLLHFRVGAAHAASLLLTGSVIDAPQAYRSGMVHEMVEAEQIHSSARSLARECALGAPEAVALSKKMLNETIGDSLFSLLAAGAALSGTARTTAAAEEGLNAFLEKRDPVWDK
ncbi:MAG: enoyl-CoA hydratase/isomerase family protein [Planctomycetota bacterium]|nr:enoyl-CoA hydratase/isomerase family protein [Planctomycetota bacterium]